MKSSQLKQTVKVKRVKGNQCRMTFSIAWDKDDKLAADAASSAVAGLLKTLLSADEQGEFLQKLMAAQQRLKVKGGAS